MSYAVIFRLLRVLLPLLKEGLFGKEKVSDVMRKNKATTAWMFAGGICFFAMITFVIDYYELETLYREKLKTHHNVKLRLVEFEAAANISRSDEVPDKLYTEEQFLIVKKELEEMEEELNKKPPPTPPPRRTRKDTEAKDNQRLLNDLQGLW